MIRRKTHLSVDSCEGVVYWVRSKVGVRGPLLVDWGSVSSSAAPVVQPARSTIGSLPAGPARAALDSAALVLRRESLPTMKSSEVRLIAMRRAADITGSIEDEACFGWLHGESGRPGPLWLCAAPAAESHEAHFAWSKRGTDVVLLASRQLALGNLVRILPDAPDSGLTAILNLDASVATCVISDRDGWVFGREFPLHDMSEMDIEEEESEQEGGERSSGPEDLENAPTFGGLDIWAMRLATEMRRTFRYAEGELALGAVTRLWVSGSSARITEVCPLLASRLEMQSTPVSDAVPDGLANAAAVALGLALWPNETGGNLLSPALVETRTRIVARRHLLGALASVSVILLLAGVAAFLFEGRQTARIGELNAKFEAARSNRVTVAEHEQTRARAAQLDEVIATIDHPLPPLSGLLALLSRATPGNAHVERLRIVHAPQGWTLILEVEATGNSVLEAASSVSDLSNTLKSSPLAVLDAIVQNDSGRLLSQPGGPAHVRFELHGRLAPLSGSVELDAPNRSIDNGVGDA